MRVEQKDSQKPELVGLMFGESSEAEAIQGVLSFGPLVLASEYGKKGWKEGDDELLGKVEMKKACTLAIEVRAGEVEVFVDGTSVGKRAYEPKKLVGGVGLYAEGPMTFRELRVRD